MERTKAPDTNSESKVIRWKKVGGGSFRPTTGPLKGRIIKPGQIFKAAVEDIPASFRDVIIALQEIPGEKPSTPPVKGIEPVYTVKSRGSGGWYDVVDAKGKALNEKALKKDIAEKLVQDLAK